MKLTIILYFFSKNKKKWLLLPNPPYIILKRFLIDSKKLFPFSSASCQTNSWGVSTRCHCKHSPSANVPIFQLFSQNLMNDTSQNLRNQDAKNIESDLDGLFSISRRKLTLLCFFFVVNFNATSYKLSTLPADVLEIHEYSPWWISIDLITFIFKNLIIVQLLYLTTVAGRTSIVNGDETKRKRLGNGLSINHVKQGEGFGKNHKISQGRRRV